MILGLLALLLQVTAPMAAPIFLLPFLVGGAAAPVVGFGRDGVAKVTSGVATAIAGGWALAFAWFLFLALGADVPELMAFLLVVVAALVGPLPAAVAANSGRKTIIVAALLFLGTSLTTAVWVRFDPVASTVPVYERGK